MTTEVDKFGRLNHCAHCGEENVLNDDEDVRYCMYCGYSLINQCTNFSDCGRVLPPTAAYCPFCGSETHYLKSGLIESKRKIIINDDDLPF